MAEASVLSVAQTVAMLGMPLLGVWLGAWLKGRVDRENRDAVVAQERRTVMREKLEQLLEILHSIGSLAKDARRDVTMVVRFGEQPPTEVEPTMEEHFKKASAIARVYSPQFLEDLVELALIVNDFMQQVTSCLKGPDRDLERLKEAQLAFGKKVAAVEFAVGDFARAKFLGKAIT